MAKVDIDVKGKKISLEQSSFDNLKTNMNNLTIQNNALTYTDEVSRNYPYYRSMGFATPDLSCFKYVSRSATTQTVNVTIGIEGNDIDILKNEYDDLKVQINNKSKK